VFVAAKVGPQVRVDQWAVAARYAVSGFAREVEGCVHLEVAFNQSSYTEERLEGLGGNLLLGAAVVMLIVLLGMGWRAALVVGAALPLSASFALFGMTFFGQQVHQMTIFGMIIAIGLLIDNAIVITDEVHKQLACECTRLQATGNAVRHILSTTLTTMAGFASLLLFTGGNFWPPLAVVIAGGVGFSAFLSLLFTPAVYYWIYRRGRHLADGARQPISSDASGVALPAEV
jgi:multidrug efflux pump subunit AcrB